MLKALPHSQMQPLHSVQGSPTPHPYSKLGLQHICSMQSQYQTMSKTTQCFCQHKDQATKPYLNQHDGSYAIKMGQRDCTQGLPTGLIQLSDQNPQVPLPSCPALQSKRPHGLSTCILSNLHNNKKTRYHLTMETGQISLIGAQHI